MRERLLLRGAGVGNGLAVALHVMFWRLFDWPDSLAGLQGDNRVLMQVMNLHLIFVLGLFAWLCLFHADDMLRTRLGRLVTAGIGAFWLLRTVAEFLYWDVAKLESQLLVAVFLAIAALALLPLRMACSHAASEARG